jgi:hypothetical protein
MHINEIDALANRLRSLVRNADPRGKDRNAILWEIADIALDLEARVARLDREMDMEYMADYAEYVRG